MSEKETILEGPGKASVQVECAQFCAIITGIMCNLLSIAFVWPFDQLYDEDNQKLSHAAALIVTLAFFGMTVGVVFCGSCISMGKSMTDYDNQICQMVGHSCCMPGILWYLLSCGVLQLAAAILMTISTVKNTSAGAGSNVIAFAAFVAAWEYLTAFFSLIYGFVTFNAVAAAISDI